MENIIDKFELQSTGGPPARKENPSLFRPPSASQTLRQAIYAQLQANPDIPIWVAGLAVFCGVEYHRAYAACKQLVLNGFATKEVYKEAKPTKKDPTKTIDRVAVKFVQPWEGKKQSKW